MEKSINIFYQALEFLINDLKKQRELCVDQRLKWLKNLYLNLFYDNGHKRFQCPTPMQALLAFGGRHFNLNTLENHFYASVNSLLLTLFLNNDTHLSEQINNPVSTNQHSPSSAISNMNKSNELNNLDQHFQAENESRKKSSIITNANERKSSFRQRKSSTSVSSFRAKTISSKFTSESIVKSDVNKNNHNISSKTPPPIPIMDRFSKLKSFRQKSLVNEIFARSSSASLERQTSFDSGSYTNQTHHQQIKKLKSNLGHSNKNAMRNEKNKEETNTNNPSNNLKISQKALVSNSTSPSSSIMSKNNPILINMLNSSSKRLAFPFKMPILFSLIKSKHSNTNEFSTTIQVG